MARLLNMRRFCTAIAGLFLLFLSVPQLHSQPVTIWQVGIDEDPFQSGYAPTDEFSTENYINDVRPGKVTRLPGDPLYVATNNPTADDDFYFAGTYPIGFNGLASVLTVPNAEPDIAFERALTDGDRTNRIHFFLNGTQAGALSRLRLSFELVWGGSWIGAPVNASGEGFEPHDIVVRFRNNVATTTLLSRRVDRDSRILVDFSAASVQAQNGPNTIEIVRTGPTAANTGFWVQFDYARLEANTNGLADADGDGLPRWWEEENHLSDTNTLDAASDTDNDGLTALQEYNSGNNPSDPRRADTDGDGLNDFDERALGSNPLVTDTDGDALSDGDEVHGVPASSPVLVDSDSDGAPDSLERRLLTNPASGSATPTVFRGAVGIHFVAQSDLNGILKTNETTGVIPQIRWNDTVALRGWSRPTGSKADIATPVSAQLVRSDGLVLSNLTLNWTAESSDASRNNGSSDRRLMDGYVRAYSTTPVSLNLTNIPFARYDLYVHVGGSYDGQHGRVRLNNNPASDRFFETATTAPQSQFVEIKPGLTNWQKANFVRYTNLTAGTLNLTVTNYDGWSIGVHALQLVDLDLDFDSSGIPDWFEMKHALQPGSTALAAADSDGDGLSNQQEYQRGSDPRRADTDGDGLADGAETAANALTADSDGDGLSDWAEVNAAIPTNPNLADSDNDGESDLEEYQRGTDATYHPTNNPAFGGWVPFYRTGPARWEWTLENVQLVWDHGAGALAPNVWNEDQLVSFAVKNPASFDWRTLGMELRYSKGSVSYLFHSEYTGGFSYQNQPSSTIWEAEYGASVPNLRAALGFSGYGPADISDRLRFRFFAQRGSGNSWSVSFEIRNQTSNTVVASRSFTNCTASATVDNGSAVWTDYGGVTNQPSMVVHQGVRMFISPTPLETLAAFAAAKDSDNDGMPDVWEDANSFNKLSAADATGDADADGVNNRDEFLSGTLPRNKDSDGDSISDGVERTYASNPLNAASKPDFAGTPWPSGQDLDGNGLPDAWEVRFQAFNLPPNGDADADGAVNAHEAKWGTNPFDAGSKPAVGLGRQGNDALVSYPFVRGKDQRLFSTTTLTNWQQYAGLTLVNNGVATARLTNRFLLASRDFYRANTEDKDTDADGVWDWAEGVFGSDATRANSVHAAMPIINSTGAVTGTVSGDYAAYVEQTRSGTGLVTRAQAARLLQQATFGPTTREIDRVRQLGLTNWIDDQLTNTPATFHRPYIEKVYADFYGPRTDHSYSYNDMDQFINGNNSTTPFARAAIGAPDQLRQRVAFALSQILVTSRRDPNLENKPLAMMDYYDIFVRHAFGNYFDVLREVTFHPVMGRYLSHIGNQKARPEINQYPDENYAREVMQLFSIGLWELNADGTRQLDGLGQPIPTYGNKEITEFARVLTGLWFGGQNWGDGGWTDEDSSVPMQMWAEKHDFGSKTLLRGYVVPARAPTVDNGVRDVEDALRNLFDHPNLPPFISRQLIQFLVTSNPSSNYIARVSAKFVDNGSGRRGDLATVVRTILLDEEARDPRWFQGARQFGRLKEPVQRAMGMARVGRLANYTNLVWWTWGEFYQAAFQEPTYSPSVFNFYRPDYRPPGLLTQFGLAGPAFQITDSYSCISFPNKLWEITESGLKLWDV